jgi:hypothetical protein
VPGRHLGELVGVHLPTIAGRAHEAAAAGNRCARRDVP